MIYSIGRLEPESQVTQERVRPMRRVDDEEGKRIHNILEDMADEETVRDHLYSMGFSRGLTQGLVVGAFLALAAVAVVSQVLIVL